MNVHGLVLLGILLSSFVTGLVIFNLAALMKDLP